METPYRDLKLDQVRELIGDGYEVVDVREDWEWDTSIPCQGGWCARESEIGCGPGSA